MHRNGGPPLATAKRKSQLTTFTQRKPYLTATPRQIASRNRSPAAEFLKKVYEVGYGCSQVVPWRRSANEKLTSDGQLSPFQQAVGAGWLHFWLPKTGWITDTSTRVAAVEQCSSPVAAQAGRTRRRASPSVPSSARSTVISRETRPSSCFPLIGKTSTR